MKAIIYARQSSGADDFSDSVENQILNCKKKAESDKIAVVGIYQDLNTSGKTYPAGAESVAKNDAAFKEWYEQQTGGKMFRSGLGDAFKHLHEIDFIIVDEMTRLYRPVNRSFLESYVNQQLAENNVKILQVKGGTIDLKKFDQSLIQTLKNAIQDEAIKNQKIKAKQQFAKMRDAGILPNGAKAFALVYEGDKKISVDPRKAKAVKFIFESIASYKPLNRILKELNSNFSDCVSKSFYPSNIYAIASNSLYCGLMHNTAGELIKAIQLENKETVSFDLWQTVQKIMVSRSNDIPKRSKKSWLPLSGKLICGHCGSRLTCLIDRGKVVYWCKNGNAKNNKQCALSRINFKGKGSENGLYETIIPLLSIAFIERHKKAVAMLEAKKNIDLLKREVVILKSKEERGFNFVIDGTITEEQFKEMIKATRAKKVELEAQIRSIEITSDDEIKNEADFVLADTFNDLANKSIENSQYEILLNQVVDSVIINDNSAIFNTVYGAIEIQRIHYKNRKYFPEWEINLIKKLSKKIEYSLIDDSTVIEVLYKTDSEKIIYKSNQLKIIAIGV